MTIFETLENNYILFENKKIGIIIDNNDKIWFNGNEITKALGYIDLKYTLKFHVKKNDKKQLKYINYDETIKKHPQTIYLSEAGMYRLILRSNKQKALKFSDWVTNDVLPSIRKYGYYKMKKQFEKDKDNLLEKINYLEKQNKLMINDMKKNKYPDGALVYIIDYSDEDEKLDGIYRLGSTDNLKTRKQIYNTHTLHNRNVAHHYFSDKPEQLEYCIRSMLYDFRYKNRKDFYICDFKTIQKAFKNCVNSLKNMKQTGGSISFVSDGIKTQLDNINKNISDCIEKIEE